MFRAFTVAAVSLALSGAAMGADPIVGSWKTQNGELSVIDRCGSQYCIVAKSGKYAGQKLGSFQPDGGSYKGRLTDPRNNATYSGKLAVSGDRLKLQGCATSVLCKTETWTRASQ
ncbi:DUF2147 domain-containing protein [Rhizobium sp. Rhizsp82]|uniref:DUF2147 domain-containing protein n=1 Tax=Rhizobium sp. Rhizsp82 TaxID=3243057 RepID=UPI0039B380B4